MHSKEPWSIPIDEEGWLCINCHGGKVIEIPPWLWNGGGSPLSLEDANRIVACVNACRGISTNILQNHHIECHKCFERQVSRDAVQIEGLFAVVGLVRNKDAVKGDGDGQS